MCRSRAVARSRDLAATRTVSTNPVIPIGSDGPGFVPGYDRVRHHPVGSTSPDRTICPVTGGRTATDRKCRLSATADSYWSPPPLRSGVFVGNSAITGPGMTLQGVFVQ